MPWAVYSTGTNCFPLLLFLISLSLVTSGIAWLHTRGVCGLDLMLVFVWLFECLVCLHVDCLVVTLCARVWLNHCSRAEQVPPCLTHETSLPSPWGTPVITRKRYCFLSVLFSFSVLCLSSYQNLFSLVVSIRLPPFVRFSFTPFLTVGDMQLYWYYIGYLPLLEIGLGDNSHVICMRISSVKPVPWLAVNLHQVFSNGAAFNTQSCSSLTS